MRFNGAILCIFTIITIFSLIECVEPEKLRSPLDAGDDDITVDGGVGGDADADGDADAAYVEQQVEEILARLTDEQKRGQMTQGLLANVSKQDLAAGQCLGSILNGGSDGPPQNEPGSWAAAIDEIQDITVAGCGIPLLYGLDAVHGNAKVTGCTVFPHNIALGATGDTDLVKRIGRATAQEARAVGVTLNFSPAVSVVRDIKWGRTYEGFGETPAINAELGAAYIRGLQGMGDLSDPGAVAATAKHYLADGGTLGGENAGNASFSEATLMAVHMPPYEAAVLNEVAAIMPSYSAWNDVRMSANSYLLTDYLKDTLGFDGFLISDWDAIPLISRGGGSYTTENVTTSMNAGMDMGMVAKGPDLLTGDNDGITDFLDALTFLDADRIDDAVRRILRIKVRMGLLDSQEAHESAYHSNPDFRSQIGSDEHMKLAREAVQKSLVLLKNENNALPLGKSEQVAVVGEWANSMGAQSGGWTVTWQGSIDFGTDEIIGETVFNGFQQVGDDVSSNADTADKVVVVIGEYPYAEGNGDHDADMSSDPRTSGPFASINLEDQPNYDLLTTTLAGDKPVILVIISGRPLVIPPDIVDACDAIVAAWLPGSRGIGVADVLYGDAPFTGKLTHTWPADLDQEPVNVDKQSDEPGNDASEVTPLYPYGHGLTY